jgi:alkylation response protein AidB-like acyl-CoA dehydrogenase
MDCPLRPRTSPGERFTALADRHARTFAERAGRHDREGSFPFENIDDLRGSGVLGATVPSELGGLGVESIHDYAVGINRLGRGDGSTGLAANMHIFRTWFIARAWRAASAAGDRTQADRWERLLRDIAGGRTVIAAILTEPGVDHLHLTTEARAVAGGWQLNGRKSFGTGSPAADVLGILCRYRDTAGALRMGLAHVPTTSRGVTIQNNWDAMGMRASGSHDVVFTDCFIAADDMIDTGPWGAYTERYLAGNAVGTLGLIAVFLGIAETAREQAVAMILGGRAKGAATRTATQYGIARMEIALAASRAILERTASIMDDIFGVDRSSPSMDTLHHLMKHFQCAKWIVTHQAIEVVDQALTLSGGAGYMSKHPLSRLYRDVRAGPFMQPFSPNEALEYIGKVALGLDPMIDAWTTKAAADMEAQR